MEYTIESAHAHSKETNGWLFPEEGKLMYELAQTGTGEGAIVEIGSWCGKSTIMFASGSKSAGREKVTAIDPFEGYTYDQTDLPEARQEWLKKTLPQKETFTAFQDSLKRAGVDDWVSPLRGYSEDVRKIYDGGPIRLLFIDGNHDESYCRMDWDMWEPLVVEGGWVLFHDTQEKGQFPGPYKVSQEVMVNSGRYEDIQYVGGTTLGRKKA